MLQHILSVVCFRLSLRNGPAGQHRSLGVWRLQLTAPELDLQLAHPAFAHWTKAGVELLNNVNFLYGTIAFSSLSLMSAVNAIKIVVVLRYCCSSYAEYGCLGSRWLIALLYDLETSI
jgi:hypothetical protein